MKNLYSILILAIMFSGCAATQKSGKVDASRIRTVCIAEHKAVREGALEAIKEGLTNRGMKYRVISGSYSRDGKQWTASVQGGQAAGCDSVLYYVALWKLQGFIVYMNYANIWMATPDRNTQLGYAIYEDPHGQHPYLKAHRKIVELIGDLFENTGAKSAPPSSSTSSAPASSNDQMDMELEMWRSVKESSNPADFEAYLSEYPNGKFTKLANNKLESLRKGKTPQRVDSLENKGAKPAPVPANDQMDVELEMWRSVKESNDPADFDTYLSVYPKGKFSKMANDRLESLRKGKTPQRVDGLENTGVKQALGPSVSPSSAPASSNEKMDMELEMWRSVMGSNYPADFEAYLSVYPKGKFSKMANDRLESLRKEKPIQRKD